jgi:L-fucose mutarotase
VLLTQLLHPEILSALGRAGHGSRVLVADGNYPFATESPGTARMVFLNLRRGLVTVTDVLEVLVGTIPIESAMVMNRPDGQVVPIHEEIRKILPATASLVGKERLAFCQEVKSPATTLVVATGEERRFANLLLVIGVVKQTNYEGARS